MKHSPFQSSYLTDFVVLEERHGALTYYPRTDQLPLLARALKAEFENMLPHRVARVDERANDFRKIERKMAVDCFCHIVNTSRPDGLQLFSLLDKNRVTHPAIVQQITEESPKGPRHWFKFYANPDFFTDILLCGRRLVFSGHAVQRFSLRVPAVTANPVKNLLLDTFGMPYLAYPFADSLVLFPAFMPSVVALPYREDEGEMFILTCLTINEMHSFPDITLPVYALNLHYGTTFKLPRIRTWHPAESAVALRELWERKVGFPVCDPELGGLRWGDAAPRVGDVVAASGHGPGSRLIFLDHIPGPCCEMLKPGEQEMEYDELKDYKQFAPEIDWEKDFQERDKRLSITEETRPKDWPEL